MNAYEYVNKIAKLTWYVNKFNFNEFKFNEGVAQGQSDGHVSG